LRHRLSVVAGLIFAGRPSWSHVAVAAEAADCAGGRVSRARHAAHRLSAFPAHLSGSRSLLPAQFWGRWASLSAPPHLSWSLLRLYAWFATPLDGLASACIDASQGCQRRLAEEAFWAFRAVAPVLVRCDETKPFSPFLRDSRHQA
jgi:hypothetical protein